MILIIAEKPSVAKQLATVVGATQKKKGYWQGTEYLVSWCIGHLVELATPEAYGEEYEKWSLDTLPILPENYILQISPHTAEQYTILKHLMNRTDVTELICATDAGREGELIFRLVYNQAECKKPFQRLWISSIEEKSILDGLKNLKPSTAYDNLYQAALCRQRADWLVGMNFTRLYSTLYGTVLPCGRVQTPTVQLIVSRTKEIKNFIPRTYYLLTAHLEDFNCSLKVDTPEQADEIFKKCQKETMAQIINVEQQEKTVNPPPLYDLTSLQRDANRLLGYSAQQTLEYLQSLYDQKLATYPRTDSRYITEDQQSSTLSVIETLLESNIFNTKVLYNYSTKNVKIQQIVNNKKVTDHHAILPTNSITKQIFDQLPTGEKHIFLLIAYRLFSAVYLPYICSSSTMILDIAGSSFSASGKEELQTGFKELEFDLQQILKVSKSKAKSSLQTLPSLSPGTKIPISKMLCEEKKTQPPSPYTEDTLLKAMETAGNSISDPDLQQVRKQSSLGTPATRANIIENIIKTGYIQREGKKLIPTEKAYTFIDIVADKVKDPILTAEWEKQLSEIQCGTLSSTAFLKDISQFVDSLVQETKKTYSKNQISFQKQGIATCPKCGKQVQEYPKSFSCESGKNGCGFTIWKSIAGKTITKAQALKLISKGKTDRIKGFTSKAGKPFDAYLVLQQDYSISFQFPPRK